MGCRMWIYEQIRVIILLQKRGRDHGFDLEVPLEDEWMMTTLRPTECYICTSEPRLLAGSILGNGSSEVYRWLLYSVLESR
jgi:hypothetical protein